MNKDALEGLISLLDNWTAFFTLLVVIGVGGELVVHVISSRANKKLIALQKSEALAQEAEIARMKKDSAFFELDIAKANKGAAEANRIAEAERLERIKIEERLSGWKLNSEAQKRLTAELKPYAKTPFDLSINPAEANFMETIDAVLLAAGWERQLPKAAGPPIQNAAPVLMLIHDKAGMVTTRGQVRIELSKELREKFGAAAETLANGLAIEGIKIGLHEIPNDANPTAIHIVIGGRQ
jgi:hypothetical protein